MQNKTKAMLDKNTPKAYFYKWLAYEEHAKRITISHVRDGGEKTTSMNGRLFYPGYSPA